MSIGLFRKAPTLARTLEVGGSCWSSDFRFIEAQERIALDDLVLPGEAPNRPRAWPPDLPPDQEKPAPTCNKPERVEAPVDPAAWCFLRFGFAKGSSFELTNPRAGQRSDCEDATIVAKGLSPRTIGTLSSCKGDLPEVEAEDGAKTDHWTARGWVGDVSVGAVGRERWTARAHLRLFEQPFPAAVSVQSEPLAREDMRVFLAAFSNGGFYPADCAARRWRAPATRAEQSRPIGNAGAIRAKTHHGCSRPPNKLRAARTVLLRPADGNSVGKDPAWPDGPSRRDTAGARQMGCDRCGTRSSRAAACVPGGGKSATNF